MGSQISTPPAAATAGTVFLLYASQAAAAANNATVVVFTRAITTGETALYNKLLISTHGYAEGHSGAGADNGMGIFIYKDAVAVQHGPYQNSTANFQEAGCSCFAVLERGTDYNSGDSFDLIVKLISTSATIGVHHAGTKIEGVLA